MISPFMVFTGSAQVRALDANLNTYTYFAPVKYLNIHIHSETYRMAYMDIKPTKPNGKVILLLHGKNFNGAYWRRTADTLTKQGYRVIIPDQIGFGKSDKPSCFPYSFHQLAFNTKKLLDTVGVSKVIVLGHSMGGMLAVRFTLMFPQTTSKLVLVNPIGLEDYKVKVPYQPIDSLYRKELRQNYESIKKYQLTSYYDNKWKPAYEEWLALSAGWTLHKDYPMVAWNSALTTDMIMAQPVVYELANIKAPTLLLIGQRDRTAVGKDLVSKEVQLTMGNYPELGRKAQAQIQNSTLIPLEDIGHLPHIEAFEPFAKALLGFIQ